MARPGDVRDALERLRPGPGTVILRLESGEELRGEYLGFDGGMARIRTSHRIEEVEAGEVIQVLLEFETPGPE